MLGAILGRLIIVSRRENSDFLIDILEAASEFAAALDLDRFVELPSFLNFMGGLGLFSHTTFKIGSRNFSSGENPNMTIFLWKSSTARRQAIGSLPS